MAHIHPFPQYPGGTWKPRTSPDPRCCRHSCMQTRGRGPVGSTLLLPEPRGRHPPPGATRPPQGSPPRPEAQTSSPVYFILVIGGLYFYVHLASRREQTTTALPIVSTHPAPGANPPCSHRLRDCSFHPHANVSNRPLKGSHLPSHATAFPQTLGFQISTAAP